MSGAALDELVTSVSAEVAPSGPVVVHGLTRSFTALVAARLVTADPGSPVVAVTPDDATARQLASDIRFFLPPQLSPDHPDDPVAPPPALGIPPIDVSPYAELAPDRHGLMARMAALMRLARGGRLLSSVVVVSALALMRRVMPKAALLARTAVITAGSEIDRDATAAKLVGAGYTRTSVVEDPGTFAVRGGVIDVFTPLYRYPVRIELFGDELESMRLFDPGTQRTLRELDELYIHPVRETIVTDGADVRRRILHAADAAHHPSAETRRVLERIEAGDAFVGVETLTPAFHKQMVPLWHYLPGAHTSDSAGAGSSGASGRGAAAGAAPARGRARGSYSRTALRWLVIEPDAIARAVADELEIAATRHEQRQQDGRLGFPPEEHYVTAAEFAAALAAPPRRIEVRGLEMYGPEALADGPSATAPEPVGAPAVRRFAIDDNRILRTAMERARRQRADELMTPLVEAITAWRKKSWRIAVAAGTLTRARQLATLLGEYDCAARVSEDGAARLDTLEPGAPPVIFAADLSAGFAVAADKLALLTADEIFGSRRRSSARQRAAAKRARSALRGGIADFSQLRPGDYLVHVTHGVGLYKGLSKLPISRSGPAIDFLHLEYQGGQLYLPVYRLSEVHRYVGAEGHTPRVDKLGGTTWQKTRKKVAVQVKALAEELLKLYAQRAALPGHAFPPSDSLFHEFEATFAFEETPDQQRAIDDVLADMEAAQAMDRLVCGDVGYGKTEVALRACLKAVFGNKQAAILVPTTVLVEQHYQTMTARFAGWPVSLGRLSRFQSRSEQLATIKGLAAGTIDVVVGTHRLLSKDVRFKALGLLVIDEEQRFGVAHKERLKRMRTEVDVLTLTATPIPRTLHMAMSGLRDLSIIATPPEDRRSIRTFVSRVDDGVLREGLRRELGRGGQVFFVCPRIGVSAAAPRTGRRGQRRPPPPPRVADSAGGRSLDDWAEHLRGLVPEARVAVAHGQMGADALEKVMVQFVAGAIDVLVSTTIVESGLDIPRANTMFIDQADSFGLAQLYQLRGRIGRSKERAFCFLLVPPPEQLSASARRRLEAIQRFTELGAGFQIASQDLEIRGGGELLGNKQSGAIAAVGFETYTTMLEDAVSELRSAGTPINRPRDPELNADVPGFIPDDYVPDTGQRLDLYKRLSSADDEDEVRLILGEIADRYGSLPREVQTLGDLMVLKVHARTLRALSLDLTAGRMSLALAEDTPLQPDKLVDLLRDKRYRLTPDMRLVRNMADDEASEMTASAHRCLLDLIACAT